MRAHLLVFSLYGMGFVFAWFLKDFYLVNEASKDIAFYLIFAAYILVLPLSRMPLVQVMGKGGYNNSNPRAQQKSLNDEFSIRASGIHSNFLESFAPFSVAMIISYVSDCDPRKMATMGITYLILRVLFLLSYLFNIGFLRSTFWGLANGIVMVLMISH
ncbi:MAG: MAPEG family protein [Bacteriovoracaceae bacterium]|nr:MAPEG family protein [Bacteriovoracaceae bacterium]